MDKITNRKKFVWFILTVGINMLGKHIVTKLGLPLWLDAVGTILAGMLMGPWAGIIVGFTSNLLAGFSDYTSAFYALVNIAVGISSGIFFYQKKTTLRKVFIGSLCIIAITGILCAPMNLVFYDGYTGNLIGNAIYEKLAGKAVPAFLCEILAELTLELPDKIISALIAYGLLCLISPRKGDEPDLTIFAVLPPYRKLIIGTIIAYAVMVMMLIQAYIYRIQSSILTTEIVVFVYLCIASAVILITISLLNRRMDEEREKYEKELTIRNKQLQAALKSAEIANKSKTSFLFNMSHDIRTPMNAIMGFTDMTVKHIDNKGKALDCLSKIRQSGDLLLSLINSVLEVSRIESGNAVLDEQPGDVRNSFTAFEDTMQELAEAKNIELSFETGDIRDRFVYWDHTRFMRILVNVISNSIKYTPEGGFVKVNCEQDGAAFDGYGMYRYTVSDNGIGMSEEFCKHVFEQFSREETTANRGIQGSGLGLAVCKSFVELMGGKITCQSRLGEGTVFTIMLPFKLREDTDIPVSDEVDEQTVTSFSGKRVLLVEDNELNREIAVDLLTEENLIVEEAENGALAVDMVKKNGPAYYDFILMDIQMPVMDGYEATKAIRKMYPGTRIPIIAVSANAFAEDKTASLSAGMDDHVAKPINVPELFGTLSKYI